MLHLDSATIDLWSTELDSNHVSDFIKFTNVNELLYAAQLKEPRKSWYLASQGHLRKVLSYYLDEPAEKIVIKRHPFGKPYLANYPHIVFNISHSGNQWIMAVGCGCLLGVDIEYCQPRKNFSALVDKCFAEEERLYWNNLAEDKKLTGFYELWTKKEAFVKATGRGIALGLAQCVVNLESGDSFLRIPRGFGDELCWCVKTIPLLPAYCCSVAVDQRITKLMGYKIKKLSIDKNTIWYNSNN